MMNYLIKVGTCADYYYPKTGTALYIASCTNNVEAAKILIKAKADPNIEHYGRTTLFPAAEKGNLAMVEYLLSLKDRKGRLKVKIDAQDKIGCTSLYYAARYGHLNVVEALTKAGAETGIKGIYGTPLDVAIEKKHNEIVTYLKGVLKEAKKRDVQQMFYIDLAKS